MAKISLATWCLNNGEAGELILKEWTGYCVDDDKYYNIDVVTRASSKRFRWKCSKDPSHVWVTTVSMRTVRRTGCPCCNKQRKQSADTTNSLYTWCINNGEAGEQLLREWTGYCVDDDKYYNIDEVAKASGKKFRWKCSKNPYHVWDAQVNQRTCSGSGCPYCSGRLADTTNSLKTWCLNNSEAGEQLLREWTGYCLDDDKIYNIDEVTRASLKRFRWKCSKDSSHVWDATVNRRTYCGTGCPYCSGNLVSTTNSLHTWCLNNSEAGEQLLREWTGYCVDDDKSYNIDEVAKASGKKFRWKCSKNPSHVWITTVYHRVHNGSGCPYCSKQRLADTTNSLQTWCLNNGEAGKHILREWTGYCVDDDKYYNIDEVARASNKKFRWNCSKDPSHVWDAPVDRRTVGGSGCPYCNGRSADTTKSLQTWCLNNGEAGEQLLREWTGYCVDDDKYYKIDEVTKASGKKFRWKCSKNPSHIWDTTVSMRTYNRSGCPYCSSSTHSLHTWCLNNSEAGEQLLREWTGYCVDDDKYYNVDEVARTSRKKFRWKCSKDSSHVWDATVNARTAQRSGCPYCNSLTNSLYTWCINNGGAGEQLLREWTGYCVDDGKSYNIDEVTKANGKRFRWKCSKNPSHVWNTTVCKRTLLGSGCPYCSKQRLQQGLVDTTNSFYTWCLNNGEAGKKLLREWTGYCVDDGKSYNIDEVTRANGKRFRWKCSKDSSHVWDAIVNSRTVQGSGCPYCSKQGKPSNQRKQSAGKTNSFYTWCLNNGEAGEQLLREWTGYCVDDDKYYNINEVTGPGRSKFRWKCLKDHSHIWDASIPNRITHKKDCPYCSRMGISDDIQKL